MKPPRAEAGFSLTELLVALALLGLISGLIASGLGLGNKIWQRSERKSQISRGQFEAEAGLARLLSTLQPVRRTDKREVDFAGLADTLEGVVALPVQVGLGGLYRLRLFIDQGEHRLALSLRSDRETGLSAEEITTVATGVKRVDIRYFGAVGGSGREEWRATWLDEDRLPKLMSLKISLLDEELGWPEFKIDMRLDLVDWQ